MFLLRQTARELGRDTVATRFGIEMSIDPATRLQDAMRAHQVARAHLGQVRLEVAKARAAEVSDPVKAALKATEYRARTITATEASSAANSERVDAAREVAEAYDIELLKEWNAEGEACPLCIEMDGETVAIDASFSNGLEPGSAHPNCYCWTEILTKTNQRAA